MRRVHEILRLKFECGYSDRAIEVAVSVARSTVQLCLARFASSRLTPIQDKPRQVERVLPHHFLRCHP
jgi:hypothetical protein